MRPTIWIGLVSASLLAVAPGFAQNAAKEPVYRVKSEVAVTGRVADVRTIPDWMGKDGVNIALQSRDGAAVLASHVDVATAGFLEMFAFPIAVGDDLQVTGCWSQGADGLPVFLVHELTKQRVTLNVRDPDGRPLW